VFVTFEGIEGSGKSTQVARLAGRLRAAGVDPLVTREPGGTPLGRRLREVLLGAAAGAGPPADPLVEALLMVADRREHVARVIVPALAAGRIVLCDRYDDSTLAYQGGGSGVDPATLAWLNHLATGGLAPRLTLLLDLPVETALARMRARAGAGAPDRFEGEAAAFHERVRSTYRALAAARPERWAMIDAARDPDAVFADVCARFDEARAKAQAPAAGQA
jgi:dTMP kinase